MLVPERSLSGEVALRTAGDTERFLQAAFAAFETASERCGTQEHGVSIAGHRARLVFAGDALRERLAPALLGVSEPGPDPSLTVCLFDSASTRTPMPSAPFGPGDVRERGEIQGLGSGPVRCAFNAGSGMLTLYDRAARRALIWTADATEVPYYETASPLRTLWAWWLEEYGWDVIHAAAVGEGGRGVLLTGRGGSGKTTTALLCVAEGMAYGGDNNLVLEHGTPARGHALFTSATVRPDTLQRVPSLRKRLVNADKLASEKGMLFVGEESGARLLPSFEIACVLLPRVTGTDCSRLVEASPGACLTALAPSSILSVPFAREGAFARMACFVRSTPAFHLELAPDLAAIPTLVRAALEGRLS